MILSNLFGKRAININNKAVSVENSNIPKDEVVTSIAMALMSNNNMAAIAMALSLYNEECHDYETKIITLKNNLCSQWNSKSIKFYTTAYCRNVKGKR